MGMDNNELNRSALAEKYEWKESEGNIPVGWKYRVVKISPSLQRVFFITSDGTSLVGKVQAIDFLQKKDYSQEKIRAFATDVIFMNGCKEDPNLPEGWKYKKVKHSSGKKMTLYLPPTSIDFLSRKRALEFLEENPSSKSDVLKLKNFEVEINQSRKKPVEWQSNKTIPEGWNCRVSKNKNGKEMVFYMTPEGLTLAGRMQAIKYMKGKNYNQSEIQKVEFGYSSSTSLASTHQWKDDPSIPPGWKLRVQAFKDGRFKTFYLPPNGTSSLGRLQAIRQMKMENYNEQDIRKLDTTSCDWISKSKNLPEGWKYRYISKKSGHLGYYFMTPDGNKLTGMKQMLQFLKENYFSIDDINKVHALVGSVEYKKRKKHVRKYNWLANDNIPGGWKYRSVRLKNGHSRMFFMKPDGSKLRGRIQLLECLRGNDFNNDVISKAKMLFQKGLKNGRKIKKPEKPQTWQEDGCVPAGWKYRTVSNGHGGTRKVYKTSSGLTIVGRKAAVLYMEKLNYSEDDIRRVEPEMEMVKSSFKNQIINNWMEDKNLPSSWKYQFGQNSGERSDSVMNSRGKVFDSRVDAIKYMIDEDFAPEDILKAWITLKLEGWLYLKGLPDGWRVKPRGATFIFLSPQMEMFNSVEDIEQIHNYEDELVNIRIFLDNQEPSSSVLFDATEKSGEREETDATKKLSDATLEEICPDDNCPDDNSAERSDNDENHIIAKKIPQDWDKEVGSKLSKSDGSFLCSECGFSTLTKVNAISHVQSNHVNGFVGYECDECGKVSPTIKTLESHMTKSHSVSVPKYLARHIIVK